MKISTSLAATCAIAVLTLVATDLSASARNLTDGAAPGTSASTAMADQQPRRAMKPGGAMHRGAMRRETSNRYDRRRTHYAATRPLVVRPAAPVVAAAPVVGGPGTLVTGPLAFGSDVVALPFRGLGTVFPANGDIATNPLVIIGAPLRAAADLAQVPFRIVGAAFGETTGATY